MCVSHIGLIRDVLH